VIRFPFSHRRQCQVLLWGPEGGSPAALVGKVASSVTCSTWNTSAMGHQCRATRLRLIGRRSRRALRFPASGSWPPSLTGRRAQPTIGFPGRGERSCPLTSPPIPERHPRRCSKRLTSRNPKTPALPAVRSSEASTPPMAPGLTRRISGGLGELDLSVAWLASARGDLRKRSPGRSAAIGVPGRRQRSYPSMSLAELHLRSRLRDSAALSIRRVRCRNGAV